MSTGKRRRSCNDDSKDDREVGEDNRSLFKREKQIARTITLFPALFKDDNLSYGGAVKRKAEVIMEQSKAIGRYPNMSCRVESFGRICQKFDDRRKRWVYEMGFAGLLNLAFDMHLPRQLAYWVMTRIDPISKMLITPDGREFKFSKNQVRWVLGIPLGGRAVPSSLTDENRTKVQEIVLKYGRAWESKFNKEDEDEVYTSLGIPLSTEMMERLEGHFDEDEEEEFKTLFLIVALEMVLCPTQSPRLAADLLPAICCGMEAMEYDWCEVVLSKLMDSVTSFSRRFYCNGYASGCGGCAIFAVLFYLDRLDRDPIDWETFPRLKAWSMKQIRIAAKSDRLNSGDFGKVGVLDVAYGEKHPRVPRDSVAPCCPSESKDVRPDGKVRQRRGQLKMGMK